VASAETSANTDKIEKKRTFILVMLSESPP
jgi:hypothetical protein